MLFLLFMPERSIPMIFDVNQTEFVSEKQKEVWQAGTHIVPLEVSLADVKDEETREGCRQIFDCIIEILTELYENADSYVYTSRWYTGDYLAWLTGSATPLKKHQEEYLRFLEKLPQFGFSCDDGVWTNERYPLFLEYFPRFVLLAKERKKNLGGYLARLDFRLFADKIKLTMDDLLRPLSDRDTEFCLVMHQYAVSHKLKVEMKDPYTFRYLYKKLYVLELHNHPFRITVPYGLDNGKRVPGQLQRFLDLVEEQPDREALFEYLKGGIRICTGCDGRRKASERCGEWADLHGTRRLTAACIPTISQFRRGKTVLPYTAYDVMMLQRMLDIRLLQIDGYLNV